MLRPLVKSDPWSHVQDGPLTLTSPLRRRTLMARLLLSLTSPLSRLLTRLPVTPGTLTFAHQDL